MKKKKAIQACFKRYEKKYMLTHEQYERLIECMNEYMEPDIYGETTNCNVYYDTDNWDLIKKSIEKPVYKEKLRVRSYGVPKSGDMVFIELKKKYDGIVYKRRITVDVALSDKYLAGNAMLSAESQIGKEIEYFQKFYQVKPKVYIAYDRTSFAGRENPDLRITFDQNIRYRDYDLDLRAGDFGERLLPEEVILMEIKVPNTAPLWMARLLSELEIRPTSYSKYGTFYKEIVVGKKREETHYSA